MNALITGATGYLGRELSKKLKSLGWHIYVSNSKQANLENVETYLGTFRKNLTNTGFNLLDPIKEIKVPAQLEESVKLDNRSYLSTVIGLAFRKLDVFGYYKFVTAAKNINLLPNRKSMFQQKKMKAISSFAFKGLATGIAALYVILFGLSFWNIHSYNKKLKDLLTPDMASNFEQAIKLRNKENIKSEFTFIGVKQSSVEKYERIKNELFASVKFVSEVISVKKDKDGKIIEGNPDKIKQVIDYWKFSKNILKKGPNWYLSEIVGK